MTDPTVLIIEDDPTLLRGLKDNFLARGFRVRTASDGRQGLDAALSDAPDLIILDIMLPKINGYEICRVIRGHGLKMPIIVLTAKSEEEDVVRGLELGADDYMTKPFSIRELRARVEMLLRRRQAVACELDVAGQVQQAFLPAAAPLVEGYEFFDFYEPANQLSGDYYDYVQLPGGRLAVVVADVSGKGIAASLVMAKLAVETRYCLAHQPAPVDAVTQLNRVFCDDACADRFVTLVLAVLDPARHEVTIVSAGHPLPLLRRGSGAVEVLAETDTGLPLGVDRSTAYTQSTLTLGPGDCLTLYTDGVTDAMNSGQELYGEERLRAQLDSGPQGAGSIGARILADVKQFVGARHQSDDVCLACFGRMQDRPGHAEALARAAEGVPITERKSTA